jgi:hypothetical protein
MTWRVEYDSELGIIHSVYAGRITADDFKEGTLKAISLAKKHKTYLILIDDSRLESAVSTNEIYEMPLFYDVVKASRRSRMALILPASGPIREDVKFYETVCRNRGWVARVFNEHQKALEWLLRKPDANKPGSDVD